MSSQSTPRNLSLRPGQIRIDTHYEDLSFPEEEHEDVVRNIMVVETILSPTEWVPFTFDDYKDQCSHEVETSELDFLMSLASQGFLDRFLRGKTYFVPTEKFVTAHAITIQ